MDETRDERAVPLARLTVPGTSGLVRPRLLHALDPVHEGRLGLVIAPAGSGKTTLLAQWARTFLGSIAWYRADSSDADPDNFVAHLAVTLALARGQREVFGHDLNHLAMSLERESAPVLLVVDEVDLLRSPQSLARLERLVQLGPPTLHLLLGARREPNLNLACTEMPDSPVSVSSDDLRFRSWEVERLFHDVYGTPMAPDEVAALTRRTEGWPAALQLFHLATRGRSRAERRRAVAALTGRSRYAQGYLSRQVLTGLPEPLGQFLRRTCVFDLLTAARCDALLGRTDSQTRLLDLEQRQALTTSDDDGLTFRYHEVLRSHLETALHEELGTAGVRDWYARAAELLEAEGSPAEALRVHARAEDWPAVQRLLRCDGAAVVEDQNPDWAEMLPASLVREDPWVGLTAARRLLHDGQLRAAADAARRAAGQFRDTVGRELCREVAHVADAFGGAPPHPADRWYDVLRAASRRGPMAAAARAYAAAESATTAGDPRAANIWSLVAALAETLAGRLTAARRTLHRLEHADEPFHTGLIARLALAALIPADERAVVGGEAVALDADLRDSSWIARLARGIVAARSGTGVGAIVAECDRLGDAWGALFISLADAVAVARTRAATPDLVALEGLGSRARAVEAGTVEAWALALHALAVATAELADAKPGARAAESFARAAGVPGAQAVAYAAIGISSTYPQRAEMLDLAAATATSVGLDCRLWESRQPEPLPVVALRAVERGPAPLHLRCFGGLQIAVGDEPVDLALLRPRARSALRRLALDADRPIHREILLESLWPDLSVAPAMHNLQVTVSSLRSVLDPSARRGSSRLIVRDGECYRLALPPGSSSDLHDFAAALDRAAGAQAVDEAGVAVSALQSALSIHADDLFPEEGPAEWVVGNRERMRLQAAEAGRLLAELLLARGDTDAAAAAAERSVQLDPYRDSSWRLLISAREQTGDLAASSQARRAYQEVLDSLSVPVNTFGPVGS